MEGASGCSDTPASCLVVFEGGGDTHTQRISQCSEQDSKYSYKSLVNLNVRSDDCRRGKAESGKLTGRILLKELMCGEGDGESRAMERRREVAIGFGNDWAKEDPRLPGDMNLETRSADPSFSQR